MNFDSKQSKFHDPLRHGDTEAATVGCRSTRPTSCARHSMEGVCLLAIGRNLSHAACVLAEAV